MSDEDKGGKGALSPETVELLKRTQEADSAEQEPSKEDAEGSSRKERLEESEREIADDNKLDLSSVPLDIIAAMRNDIIYNDKRRRVIEGRLEPLDISDLVTKREIVQSIPVIPGKLIYDLRTLNEQDHLFCLQYVYEFPGSARYVEELLNMCRLVCSFVSLNGKVLPDHRDKVGKLDEEVSRQKFEKKLKLMTLYPTPLIADVGAQYHWFIDRVNKLFDVDTLKNG